MESGADLGESRWIRWLCYSHQFDQTKVGTNCCCVFSPSATTLLYPRSPCESFAKQGFVHSEVLQLGVYDAIAHFNIGAIAAIRWFQLLGKKWFTTQTMDDIPR